MRLKHLGLTNFRSYSRLECDFPDGILLLKGGNAVGKTSILESLFYCATFATSLAKQDRQLMHFDHLDEDPAVTRIVAVYDRDNEEHKLEIRFILEGADESRKFRKEILVDGRKTTAQNAIGRFPAVLFLPHMTEIIDGSPSERRRYLNILLSQAVPRYAGALSQYTRAVMQRNALLRQIVTQNSDPKQLDYWDEMLATRGAFLVVHRAQAIRALEGYAAKVLRRLTDAHEQLTLQYQPAIKDFDATIYQIPSAGVQEDAARIAVEAERLRTNLKRERGLDLRRGVSTVGPHRDEMRVFTNGIDVGTYGSRGQVRTVLLALKFAEADWLRERVNTSPLLLLDETFSELDAARREALMGLLRENGQCVITTTDLLNFSADFVAGQTVWEVKEGGILDFGVR